MVLQGNLFGARREFVSLCHLDAGLVIFMNSANELKGSKQDSEGGEITLKRACDRAMYSDSAVLREIYF